MPSQRSCSRPWMYFMFTGVLPAAVVALLGFSLMFVGQILAFVGVSPT